MILGFFFLVSSYSFMFIPFADFFLLLLGDDDYGVHAIYLIFTMVIVYHCHHCYYY